MGRPRGDGLTVRGNVLVVPPFECAWLKRQGGAQAFLFEASAKNDVTLMLHSRAGGKRMQRNSSSAPASSYTVIIGSHCNSRLVIERNARIVHTVSGVKTSASAFTEYWVTYNAKSGVISVGFGWKPGWNCLAQWRDEDPFPNIEFLGLSAWDSHVCFRSLSFAPAPAASQHYRAAIRPPPSMATLQSLSGVAVADCLTVSSCLAALAVAEDLLPQTEVLLDKALNFLAANFACVVQRHPEEVFSLSHQSFRDILERDKVSVPSERWLFEVVMQWKDACCLGSASPGGASVTDDLIQLLRFPVMTREDLDFVRSHACHRESAVLRHLVREEVERRMEAEARGSAPMDATPLSIRETRMIEFRDRRLQVRRHPNAGKELLYVSDGDENGVLFFLGTNQRSVRHFVNPALTSRVEVCCSSPQGRFTEPKAVLARRCHRFSFFEGGKNLESWWQVNLKVPLQCNYYSVRHDGSVGFLRNWELRASNDGTNFMTLSHHEDDRAIVKPYQYASFPIPCPARAYSIYRLVLTGANACGENKLCLTHFECYGLLLD